MGRWLALALQLPFVKTTLEPSCEGYHYNGIDWAQLRSTLEVYADKYLDRPQLLAEVFHMASGYALEYHPENACTLGDLSLRLFLWLCFEEETLRGAISSVSRGAPQTHYEQLVQEAYDWFWELNFTWPEVMRSGWPLFSILSAAANRVKDAGQSPCVSTDTLSLYVDSFDNAIYVPAHVDAVTISEAGGCPEAVASALISLADNARTTGPSKGNRYYRFTSSRLDDQPKDNDVSLLLARAEGLLRNTRGWRLLTTQWPVWRLLDRLSAAEIVNVTHGQASFWMYVFPHRVRSDGIISNRIRATRKAYCLQQFQDEVLRLANESQDRLRLVEAGPHIGDCMLWAAAVLGDRAKGLAVEPVPQVVSLFRKSIAANGFDIELHHAMCGDRNTPTIQGSSVPWIRLDSVLAENVDVLKIHTNGGERAILEGASGLFLDHQVRVVLVHSAEPDELWRSAMFLVERGYSANTGGRPLTVHDEFWLKSEVRSRGGLQIHALAATSHGKGNDVDVPVPLADLAKTL